MRMKRGGRFKNDALATARTAARTAPSRQRWLMIKIGTAASHDGRLEVFTTAPESGDLVVSLHPDDFHALVGDAGETDFEHEGRRVCLRADAALRPGDAVAESGMATVDATIAAAVARAREALRL